MGSGAAGSERRDPPAAGAPSVTRPSSVVLIGLDAGDPDLIERWAAEGHLPTFARLLRDGAYGRLDSTAAVLSGTPWTSIASGCNPAKCGVYTRHQLASGTYTVRRVKAGDVRQPPFWHAFRGPVVVVDVPKAPPSPAVDGAQLVEWGAYDHYAAFSSIPETLSADVLREFGRHPFLDWGFEETLPGRRDFAALRAALVTGVRMKHRLNLALLERVQPRFFFSVFGETHAAGHAFWRFQDPRHPRFEPDGVFATALRDVYRAIDLALGEFCAALPPACTLVVLSGHGFTMDNLAGDLLQEVLSRLGLTVPRQTLTPYAPYVPALALDMTRSQAFSLPTDWQGLIRINLQGREPRGVVAAGAYDAVCEELDTELRGLRHRGPDVPVVDRVVRIRDVFAGPFADALPDLSVLWNPAVVVTEVTSRRAGAFRREPDLSGGGGNHQGVGFMLACGASIPRGRFTGHVFDVAPTVAGLLGERPRPEWDGVALAFANPAPAA